MASLGVARVELSSGYHQGRSGLIERCIKGQAQAPVNKHAQGRASQGQGCGLWVKPQRFTAHCHPRLIGQDTLGTGQYHAGARTQTLHRRTRCRAGDPLALAAGHGRAAVQAHRQLGPHKW
ncbi:hypothetical protein D3C77_502890 [compost metagenome]